MVRQRQDNAFTMVESLLVLLIVTVLSISIPKITFRDTAEIIMKNLVSLCVYTQEKAFLTKENKSITFYAHSVQFDDYTYDLPSSMACDVQTLNFNEKGNINKANTIHCMNRTTRYKIVFQLGSGRVRYEKE